MRINLKNVASYGENPVVIETDRKVNLFYGLNGTGKTVFSDFLYHYQRKEINDNRFNDCELEGVNNAKILVYNQSFIRDNFYNQDELKGIFTLSKENKEAAEAIRKTEQDRKELIEKKSAKKKDKQHLENSHIKISTEIKEYTWEIKTKYTGGDRVLEFCLEGLKSDKSKLFDHIRAISNDSKTPDKTIQQLKDEAQEISKENASTYPELLPVDSNANNIEGNDIFSEVIIGSQDSPVATLIEQLSNSDWVKQGLGYLQDDIESTQKCPFCQEQTITKQVAENIREYFDETYEQKIQEIQRLAIEYESPQLPNIIIYKNHPIMKESNNDERFVNLFNRLQSIKNENIIKIKTKLDKPSNEITLNSIENETRELNDFIIILNNDIREHNNRIENKQQTKEKIKEKFWKIMRLEYNSKIAQYEKEYQEINTNIKEVEKEIDIINSEIENYDTKIQNQQANMVNLEEAITNINKGLNELGIEGFKIVKYSENLYRIEREEHQEGQFSTLSEGEKMIISFLYFMELCKGKESKEELKKDKIVVIDDPISSLSHIYIFNTSQWIKSYFFDTNTSYKKVFVLTHSLYFFHELIKYGRRNQSDQHKLFRLTKSPSAGTKIQDMKQNEIQNEYQSYWQIVKDYSKDDIAGGLLANSMRNILEHFFGFIKKDTLQNVLDSLPDENSDEYVAFRRYMDRESHSDAVNISDTKELDSSKFMSLFRKVFCKTGYEDHYKKMMGIEN